MGEPKDFVIEEGWYTDHCLREYHGSGGDVIVPDGVEEIMTGAFSKCDRLRSVTLPPSVVAILEGAFSECDHLQSVVYAKQPKYTIEISPYALYQCPHQILSFSVSLVRDAHYQRTI